MGNMLVFLASGTSIALYIVLPIIGLLVGAVGGVFAHYMLQKKKVGETRQIANKMIKKRLPKRKPYVNKSCKRGKTKFRNCKQSCLSSEPTLTKK